MKKIFLVLTILAVAVTAIAQDEPSRLKFDINGFSVAPLEGTSDSTSYQVVTMFLPSDGGFSPNVNIQVQNYAGTIAEYSTLSKEQFQKMGWNLIEEKNISPTAMTLEYTGTVQGTVMHFYARVESRDGKVYLATGMATKGQWPDVSPRLKKCVNSFRLE